MVLLICTKLAVCVQTASLLAGKLTGLKCSHMSAVFSACSAARNVQSGKKKSFISVPNFLSVAERDPFFSQQEQIFEKAKILNSLHKYCHCT